MCFSLYCFLVEPFTPALSAWSLAQLGRLESWAWACCIPAYLPGATVQQSLRALGRCRELRVAAAAWGPGSSPTVPQDSQLCLLDPCTPMSQPNRMKEHLEEAWGVETRGDPVSIQEFLIG